MGSAILGMTPLPDAVQAALNAGDVDAAFTAALSMSDLKVVMPLCATVNLVDVFPAKRQTALSQPVLLSLIQQLAFDLSADEQLKTSLLTFAVQAIDVAHAVTGPYVKSILEQVKKNIEARMDLSSIPTDLMLLLRIVNHTLAL